MTNNQEEAQSFRFEGVDNDMIVNQYCEWTSKTYLKTDAVQATITLKVDRLTTAESIQVSRSDFSNEQYCPGQWGEKFIKVVQANSPDLSRFEGMKMTLDPDITNSKF